MQPHIQSLRIHAGWAVEYNEFYEIDQWEVDAQEGASWFKEDLLQLRHVELRLLIDLGFYPEGNLEAGEFALVMYQPDFQGTKLFETRSKSRRSIVTEVEKLTTWEIARGFVCDKLLRT